MNLHYYYILLSNTIEDLVRLGDHVKFLLASRLINYLRTHEYSALVIQLSGNICRFLRTLRLMYWSFAADITRNLPVPRRALICSKYDYDQDPFADSIAVESTVNKRQRKICQSSHIHTYSWKLSSNSRVWRTIGHILSSPF